MSAKDEEERLRSAALQNSQGLRLARRRAEEKLRKQSELMRITLASIGDGVISTDADGRVTFMNSVAESLTGWNEGEAVGRPLSDVFHIVDDRTRQAIENPALRSLRDGTITGVANHTVLIARDGTERPIDDRTAPLRDDPGTSIGAVLVFRDVSERKRAEEVRALLAAIVESSDDAIVSKTLDGTILTWNAGAERLFGYTPSEVVGRPITLIIPPERLDEERAILDRLCRGERIEHFETVRVSKTGRRIDISLTISPVRNAEGHVIGASKIARDITQRVRAEQEHRQLVSLVETSSDLIGLAALDGRILYFNDAGLNLLGINSLEEAKAKSLFDFVPPEYLATLKEQMIPALHVHGRWEGEWCYRNVKTGRPVRVSKKVTLIRDAKTDTPVAFATVSRDMTDRMRAEEELRGSEERLWLALDAGSTGVWDWDIVTGNITWSDRIAEFHGMQPDEFDGTIGMFLRHLHPGDAERVNAAIHASLEEGAPYRIEYRITQKNGNVRWLNTSGKVIHDDGGRPIRMIGATTDVTERRQMEDELRRADRKKDEFIALMAHELRNPLAPLRNGLQVMRLAVENTSAVAQARDMMERQLGHLTRLIDDLLDISRISQNKMELRRSQVQVADVVNSAVETARPMIESAGHELSVSLPHAPVILDADLTRLAQVFSNLLTNSAKYTPPGGRIWLTAEPRGNMLEVSVRDTGIGIPAHALPHIFDMFSQVDRSIERSTGGLGIGLALVKGLVEMHNGTVAAASDGPGKGTTFTVMLPLRPTLTEPIPPSVSDNGRIPTGPRRRILVVDDNHDSATSMAMMLKLMGNEVREAHDGVEAVEIAEAFRPQVILMDVGMPRLNGLDATRRIRKQSWGQSIVIIALTGWGQLRDKTQSQEAGCDEHLVKPVDLSALETLLVKLMR